eukprot:4073181-Prymnesium_polylepis.1
MEVNEVNDNTRCSNVTRTHPSSTQQGGQVSLRVQTLFECTTKLGLPEKWRVVHRSGDNHSVHVP